MKYHPSASGFGTQNYILMRYSDAHLMRAEALFRAGNTAQALLEVNELRGFRNAAPLASVTADDILDERGRELYWEGLRRTDLIRHDLFTTSQFLWPWKGNQRNGTGVQDFRRIFPIPSSPLFIAIIFL